MSVQFGKSILLELFFSQTFEHFGFYCAGSAYLIYCSDFEWFENCLVNVTTSQCTDTIEIELAILNDIIHASRDVYCTKYRQGEVCRK
jgi:hypothetical protein